MRTGGPDLCFGPGAIKGVGDRLIPAIVRAEARDLAEQLTLSEAKTGAGQRIMQGQINDPNFPGDAWAKMQHVHQTPGGQNIVIHYWERLIDNVRTGFKFKD